MAVQGHGDAIGARSWSATSRARTARDNAEFTATRNLGLCTFVIDSSLHGTGVARVLPATLANTISPVKWPAYSVKLREL